MAKPRVAPKPSVPVPCSWRIAVLTPVSNDDGETEFIVADPAVDQIADGIVMICDNPHLLQTMRRRLSGRSKMFSVDQMVASTVDVYRSANDRL